MDACGRCRGKMIADVDMGRAAAGGGCGMLVTQVFRCLQCGHRVYLDQPVVKQMAKAGLVPDPVRKRCGGRLPGFESSPAFEIARTFYKDIARQLRQGVGWPTIASLLKQATGQRFTQRTLTRCFMLEDENQKTLTSQRRSAAAKQSAAARVLRNKGVSV